MNFHLWLSDQRREVDQTARAVEAWERIQEKPTSITVKRGSSQLPAQTVRLEISNAQSLGELEGEAGKTARQMVVAFGVIGHPVIDDTDLKHGDRFAVDGKQYTVISVINTHGELQATCEALS
jgi:hypothetical protein